ncbi:hypothetical protein O181_060310 [Austropuccinia psidii MF-1]|uniref:Hydrophobin n=1 Tax=Austropuccinia psidii MF-1 TaxID=1389203 RepID=A0A9Q3EK91_9BASI|nr:hypothetical protein [Austropuccinia psidii MF-1]
MLHSKAHSLALRVVTFLFLLVTPLIIAKAEAPVPQTTAHDHEHDHHDHITGTELATDTTLTNGTIPTCSEFSCPSDKNVATCAKSADSVISTNNSIPAEPATGNHKWRRQLNPPNNPTPLQVHCPNADLATELCCDQSISKLLQKKKGGKKKYTQLCVVPQNSENP